VIIDLHTHTREYSACSYLPMEQLITQAMAVGLDGVAVTDHSRIEGAELAQELGAKYGIHMFRGVEAHTTLGDILVFGLYRDLPWHMDGGRLLREVVESEAVAILAHPFRHAGFGFNLAMRTAGVHVEEALSWCPELRWVTAVEVLNDRCPEAEAAQAQGLAEALGLPGVGGSDAHVASQVGSAVTRFPEPIATDEELVSALRGGDYVAERWT
jgi:predicted metal-dependent phosphoesterase TrpH